MEIFLDENLPKNLWKALRAAGYLTTRLVDEGLRGRPNSAIFRQIRSHATIITRDKDFLKTEQFPIPHSGIIVVRLPNSTPVAEVVREVLNALATLKEQDLTNKVFVVEPDQVRLRP